MILEDRLLVWQLQRGSGAALRKIYQKYKGDLLRLAASLLNDTGSAEDVVHDVFVMFIKSCSRFQLRGSLKGYLATCVANRARNVNRGEHHRQPVAIDQAADLAAETISPANWLIRNEEFTRLTEALAQLPYHQREAITLHLHGGMVFREIAQLQDVSIKTVQSRYRYGLDKLRAILSDESEK